MEQKDTLNQHNEFYFDDLYLKVEGSLFKVLRRTFEHNSQIFCDMFSVPSGKGSEGLEGSSAQNPIHLEGVSKDDMAQLLRILYPRHFGLLEELTSNEWMGVLRLAKLWRFDEVRAHALVALRQKQDPFLMIELYSDGTNELDADEWLIPAVEPFVLRRKRLTTEEGYRLGMGCTLQVCAAREMYTERITTTRPQTVRDRETVLNTVIREAFNLPVPGHQVLEDIAHYVTGMR